jgi:hypothetical protein
MSAWGQARNGVGREPGRKTDNDAHRPRRVGLRYCDAQHGRQRSSARCQMQERTAGKFHFEPPITSFDHLVGARKPVSFTILSLIQIALPPRLVLRAPKDLAVALARPSCVRHLFLLTLQKGQ